MVTIQFFDPDAASAAEWARFHAFRRQRAAEDDPGEPILDDAGFEHTARHRWPLFENNRLIALRDDEVVGALTFSFRREGSPNAAEFAEHAFLGGGVRRAWRRRGVATALLRALLPNLEERGRTLLTADTRLPDGHGFMTAIGAAEKHRMVENRLDLAGLDWPMLAGWEAIPATPLRWERHAGRVPLNRLAELVPQMNRLFADVPLGTLDVPPPRFEMPALIASYEEMDRHGGAHFLVLLTPGEELAAMCDAGWDARFPDRVFQGLTAVAPGFRGRGLAKAVKAAMLRLIREQRPEVRMLTTSNAEVNAAMLAVNAQLGFAPWRQLSTYQIGRAQLAAWLALRPGAQLPR